MWYNVGMKRKAEKLKRAVLVGTYKGDQLTKWRGWYNYPISDNDFLAAKNAKSAKTGGAHCPLPTDLFSINELWLFNGTKDQINYKASFVGIKTREELIRDYGYPATGKAHGERYLLFKTDFKYRHKGEVPEDAELVIIRAADFARRSPKVAAQLKAYLESPDRKDPDLAKRLPTILTKLRPEQLRVCELLVQYTFFPQLYPQNVMEYTKTDSKHYRIVSLFAGCGGLDLGFSGGFDFLGKRFKTTAFDIVWANEWNPAACKTYSRNLGPHVVCGDVIYKVYHAEEYGVPQTRERIICGVLMEAA